MHRHCWSELAGPQPRSNKFHRACVLVVAFGCLLTACESGDASKSSATATAETKSAGSTTAATKTSAKSTSSAATTSKPTAEPKKEEGVAITKHYPVVGDKATSAKNSTSDMKVDIKGPKGEVKIEGTDTEIEEKVEECLAVDGKKCSKLKVTYTKVERKETSKDGKSKDKPSPHNGKSYLIELKDGAVTVTDADGKEPPKPELETVKKDYRNFAKESEMLDALPERVKVGDSLDALAKALTDRAMNSEDKPSKIDAKITVKEIKEEGGKQLVVLDVVIAMEGEDAKAGGHIKVDMKGTVTLRGDIGLATKLELKGPVTVTYDEKTSKGGASGKVEGQTTETTTYSYSF